MVSHPETGIKKNNRIRIEGAANRSKAIKAPWAVLRLAKTGKYVAKLPTDGASVVPQGRLTIARRFNAGWRFAAPKVPQGRLIQVHR